MEARAYGNPLYFFLSLFPNLKLSPQKQTKPKTKHKITGLDPDSTPGPVTNQLLEQIVVPLRLPGQQLTTWPTFTGHSTTLRKCTLAQISPVVEEWKRDPMCWGLGAMNVIPTRVWMVAARAQDLWRHFPLVHEVICMWGRQVPICLWLWLLLVKNSY